jgi:CubicO group peptidase (beta-lactamase class C family)
LDPLRGTATEKNLGLYGIHICRSGEEPLTYRWRSDDKVCLYSASKTFTSAGVGICADEGRLSLTDKVIGFFPEYRGIASEGSGEISIRDLLHMSSGKRVFYFSGTEEEMETHDWAELFFKDPMKEKPGEGFFYSNACTYMLSRIVEKVTGSTLRNYLVPRLFDPLGIFNPQWHTCPGQHTLGASGLYLKTDEFARLGQVFLNGGTYKDKRIVSTKYIDLAVNDKISSNVESEDPETLLGYGYQAWKCSYGDAYRMDGLYGQFCIIFPEKETVVTITAHNESHPYDILRAVYTDIMPNLD